jgi:hypothetical protein
MVETDADGTSSVFEMDAYEQERPSRNIEGQGRESAHKKRVSECPEPGLIMSILLPYGYPLRGSLIACG